MRPVGQKKKCKVVLLGIPNQQLRIFKFRGTFVEFGAANPEILVKGIIILTKTMCKLKSITRTHIVGLQSLINCFTI